MPLLDHCSVWNVLYIKCFVLVWQNKRVFLWIVINVLPFSLSHTCLTSCPFSPQISFYLTLYLLGQSLLPPLLSLLATAMRCRAPHYAFVLLSPCSRMLHQSLHSKVGASLAWHQRMSADDEGASTGGCVLRSSLLPCWVPGVHPFMDIMCSFFFHFSFVQPEWISIWCKCSNNWSKVRRLMEKCQP